MASMLQMMNARTERIIKQYKDKGEERCHLCAMSRRQCTSCYSMELIGRQPVDPMIQYIGMREQ